MAIAGEQKTVTRFQNTDGEIIASSEWRMGAEEDVISILGHASALSFNAFFKKAFLPFNEWVSGNFMFGNSPTEVHPQREVIFRSRWNEIPLEANRKRATRRSKPYTRNHNLY